MVWLIHVLFHSIELVCPLSYVLLMVTAVHMQYIVPLLYRYSIYMLYMCHFMYIPHSRRYKINC